MDQRQERSQERLGDRSRVSTTAAMRARDVSRPTGDDLDAAEARAGGVISARLAGRSPRDQAGRAGSSAERS